MNLILEQLKEFNLNQLNYLDKILLLLKIYLKENYIDNNYKKEIYHKYEQVIKNIEYYNGLLYKSLNYFHSFSFQIKDLIELFLIKMILISL